MPFERKRLIVKPRYFVIYQNTQQPEFLLTNLIKNASANSRSLQRLAMPAWHGLHHGARED